MYTVMNNCQFIEYQESILRETLKHLETSYLDHLQSFHRIETIKWKLNQILSLTIQSLQDYTSQVTNSDKISVNRPAFVGFINDFNKLLKLLEKESKLEVDLNIKLENKFLKNKVKPGFISMDSKDVKRHINVVFVRILDDVLRDYYSASERLRVQLCHLKLSDPIADSECVEKLLEKTLQLNLVFPSSEIGYDDKPQYDIQLRVDNEEKILEEIERTRAEIVDLQRSVRSQERQSQRTATTKVVIEADFVASRDRFCRDWESGTIKEDLGNLAAVLDRLKRVPTNSALQRFVAEWGLCAPRLHAAVKETERSFNDDGRK